MLKTILTALGKVVLAAAAFIWHIAGYLIPVVLWMVGKYIKYYVFSTLNKATRVLKWVVWIIGLLPKSSKSIEARGGAVNYSR